MAKQSKLEQIVWPIGGLSNPSKMPTLSYSLPANRCLIGSKLCKQAGTTCSECYARKGCYMFQSTVLAMARRMQAIDDALTDDASADLWVETLASALNHRFELTSKQINRKGQPGKDDGRFFRFHDSGDLQSVEHLILIARVASLAPRVKIWLPTRETAIVATYLAQCNTVPSNLIIRVSLPKIDRQPARVHHTLASHDSVTLSGVHSKPRGRAKGFRTCGAYRRADQSCGPCRACWSAKQNVSYPLH